MSPCQIPFLDNDCPSSTLGTMGKIDFLLHENATGYALFKVVSQPDRISGADSQNLATFGKMVQLVNFAPWR